MSTLAYILVYLAVIGFIAAVVYKIMDYLKKPMHVRWELYPVAHEADRASYGGSYLEDSGWWKKPRKISRIGELKVMIPEILLFKAVWEHNRSLWYITYPFHLGLYLIIGWIAFLGLGAIFTLAGMPLSPPSVIGSMIIALTSLLGPAGFILALGGAIGLVHRRITDQGLKNYTSPEHFFNLAIFIVLMIVAILTWLIVDPYFNVARQFVANLITFNFVPVASGLFIFQIILAALILVYIPLTHMSHFFMKYFLYHDIRWGDEPNVNNPKTEAKIGVVLNYPVSWGASHIAGHGRTTWAEVATFNPAQPEEEKE